MANSLWATAVQAGLAANMPAAIEVPDRTFAFYYQTDTGLLKIWNGSAFVDAATVIGTPGSIKLTPVATAALPAAPVTGQVALVNDATTPLVGVALTGGSNKLALAAWSGSAWIVV